MNSEMHLYAMIERVRGCTCWPSLCELKDALGHRDETSLEMHLQAVMEGDWRSTWMW